MMDKHNKNIGTHAPKSKKEKTTENTTGYGNIVDGKKAMDQAIKTVRLIKTIRYG
jgi:hypothetical protein